MQLFYVVPRSINKSKQSHTLTSSHSESIHWAIVQGRELLQPDGRVGLPLLDLYADGLLGLRLRFSCALDLLAGPGAPAAARLPVSRVTMEIEDDDDAAAVAARWPSSFKRRHLLQFLLHASKVSTILCL